MPAIRKLTGAAYGIHFADQIALVSVPLVAVLVFDASPAAIGALVACQSSAHLLGSLPFGVLVDQRQLRTLAIASALLSLAGFSLAVLSVILGALVGLGVAVTLAGFGVVLFGLTALSIIPRLTSATGLGRANASIEVPRAVCSFAVPLAVGLLIDEVPGWALYAFACGGALTTLWMAISLPSFKVSPRKEIPVLPRIAEGGRYVLRHPLLLPISLCSVFWNFAFAALLVVLVPALQGLYLYDPSSFGISLAAFGFAAICGSWLAGRLANLITPSVILLFGPGSSIIASFGLIVIGSNTPVYALYGLFFLLGFGPSMWLVAQNSVRQLVTPPDMLGRVNAVIQTAIYGVRPVGALVGGVCATQFGIMAGLQLVLAAYIASFAASLFSDLRRVSSYGALSPD
ncbi:MAG: MFS transporter [Pseudomonadota bacterium]